MFNFILNFNCSFFWVLTNKFEFRLLNWVSVASFGLHPLAWGSDAKLRLAPSHSNCFCFLETSYLRLLFTKLVCVYEAITFYNKTMIKQSLHLVSSSCSFLACFREYNEIKEEIKNPQNVVEYII